MDRLTTFVVLVALSLVGCGSDDPGPPGVVQEFRAERVQEPVPSAASAQDISDVPLLLLLSEIGSRGFDLALITELTAQWVEPSSGAPVSYYVLEYEARSGSSMLNMNARYIIHDFYDVSLLASMDSIRGRAAGVDQLGRIGDWTPWTAGTLTATWSAPTGLGTPEYYVLYVRNDGASTARVAWSGRGTYCVVDLQNGPDTAGVFFVDAYDAQGTRISRSDNYNWSAE